MNAWIVTDGNVSLVCYSRESVIDWIRYMVYAGRVPKVTAMAA